MMADPIHEDQRSWIAFAGDPTTVLAGGADTDGEFGLLATRKPAGSATPNHEHVQESETIYVLSGELSAQTVEGVRTLGAGDAATLPPSGRHRLVNLGAADAHYLLLCRPAGFEDFVAEAGVALGKLPHGFVPPSKSDVAHLTTLAPNYGIRLLGSDALPEVAEGPRLVPSRKPRDSINVVGIGLTFLEELGEGDGAVALIRAVFQPGTVIPLHSHPDSELFYVLEGALDLYRDEGGWVRLGPSEICRVSPDKRHAVRIGFGKPVVALAVTTGRLLRFFRAITRPAGAPHGPPITGEIVRMVAISEGFGHWYAAPNVNAAIGLTAGVG